MKHIYSLDKACPCDRHASVSDTYNTTLTHMITLSHDFLNNTILRALDTYDIGYIESCDFLKLIIGGVSLSLSWPLSVSGSIARRFDSWFNYFFHVVNFFWRLTFICICNLQLQMHNHLSHIRFSPFLFSGKTSSKKLM